MSETLTKKQAREEYIGRMEKLLDSGTSKANPDFALTLAKEIFEAKSVVLDSEVVIEKITIAWAKDIGQVIPKKLRDVIKGVLDDYL